MAENDSVSQKQFYDGLRDVEKSIIGKIDEVKVEVKNIGREMGEVKTTSDGNSKDIEVLVGRVDKLKDADRGFAAIASAIGGAIGSATAIVMEVLRRNP